MSDEQFLARWSRRKQEARADHTEPAPDNKAPAAHASAPCDRTAAEATPAEPELANLPPIESIDAATDITAFLHEGIPQELRRAALRRAWSADPAIRDFVGLAENAWDFNDPNAMAGFGPLDYSAEQVDALVRRIVGGVVESAESSTNPLSKAAEEGAAPGAPETDLAQSSHSAKAITKPRPFEEPALPSNSAAAQPPTESDMAAAEDTSLPRRTHGGALPR